MANLIITRRRKEVINLNELEVRPEESIEQLIFDKNLIPDVFLLKRQLTTYSRQERIDIVGIDNENNIVVIEIKDEAADESVIPQVMRYAVWVETHPDAIKSIWLEQDNVPEDAEFDWEKEFNIRIMVIAPAFKLSVQRLIDRIKYPVDLIEFKKFNDGKTDYIFLNTLQIEETKPMKPVVTTREYDKHHYERIFNTESAREFWRLARKLENYVKSRGWNLTRKNNRSFISFKYGFFQVLGITFVGSKSFCLFFKIPERTVKKMKTRGGKLYKYSWKGAQYKVESAQVNLSKYSSLFRAAYDNVIGRK